MIKEVDRYVPTMQDCERVEIHDENVVICKDCSKVYFNMEAWLNAHNS